MDKSDSFKSDLDPIASFGETDSHIWVRFALRDSTSQVRRWLIDTNRTRTYVLRKINDYGLLPLDLDRLSEYSRRPFSLGSIVNFLQELEDDLSIKVGQIELYIPWPGGTYQKRVAQLDKAFQAWQRGFRPARYFVLAWSAWLPGGYKTSAIPKHCIATLRIDT